uniref:Putative Endonuclease/exonuclease/phosphatase family protein n=1 Tax=Magnetococcus massalia (strain MO-1) TaxID=451514 RepID=A0A1S7LJP6_MAGMO|nr:putative Endonuclease/exonuclease/phosphatase family protein [Candidatus Magnetococcus massalia]
MSEQRSCFHLNTMAGGDGRRFWPHIYIHYAIHYKRPVQALLEELFDVRLPFKWQKRSLSGRRAIVYPKLNPNRICDQLLKRNQSNPIDVLGLCEVLRSQQPRYLEALQAMGYSTIHTALGHKPKGIKDHLSVILATREPTEAIPIPHPFTWGKMIGGGGGAILARGLESGIYYLYLHLCTTEKMTLYQKHMQTLNSNLNALPMTSEVVLMGDFNYPIKQLRTRIPALAAFNDCMNQPETPTFLQWWDRRSVDHILARGRLPANAQGEVVTELFNSDHAAVQSVLVSDSSH